MEDPYITVVITTYNRTSTVCRALDSAIYQGVAEMEVIVVNDGSSADYSMVYEHYRDRVEFIEHATNRGVAAARNSGIQAARGEWIAFLDDDDEYEYGYLSGLSHMLKGAQEDVGFAWASVIRKIYDEWGQLIDVKLCSFNSDHYSFARLNSVALSIGCGYGFVIKKTILEAIGGFDRTFSVAEDTEMTFRLLSSGYKPLVYPPTGVVVHEHKSERLTKSFNVHSGLRVVDRLVEHYLPFIKKYGEVYAGFMTWSVLVHYKAGNYRYGDKALWKMIRNRPLDWLVWVRCLWLLIVGGKRIALAGKSWLFIRGRS